MNNIDYLKKYYKGNIDDAIKRLEKGEPAQYIVVNVDFYNVNLIVNKNVLIPRFETEELVSNTINYINKYFDKKVDILDIGTGSGAIAITLSKNTNSNVIATDISKEAIKVAKENASNNGVKVDFINTNLFDNINKKFDIVISNPPYIAKDEEIMDIVYNNEPHLALYADNNGLYYYEEILKNISKILNNKYLIAFEIGESQAKEISNLANKYLKNIKIIVKKDMQQRDRMVFIQNFE